jgi:hypothetical protein
MTIGGWIFMIGSISFVVALVSFCFYRVLSKPAAGARTNASGEKDRYDRDTP